MSEYPELPGDGNHALLVGMVSGAIFSSPLSEDEATKDINIEMIGGDYSDTLKIERLSGAYYVKIFPAPED